MEPVYSLACLQEQATGTYPEPDKVSPNSYTVRCRYFNWGKGIRKESIMPQYKL